jgi:two-component system response regulator GlrR
MTMNRKSPPLTSSLGFGITPKQKPVSRKAQHAPQAERKARILVVDGDAESSRMLCIRLTAANYSVESVTTAQAALDACVIFRPNLVITDLHFNGTGAENGGLALLKELKSRWPAVVVIIVTAHGTIAEAVQATQSGAFGFLVKPVEKSELLGQIERAISDSTFTLVEGDWRASIVSRSQLMDERLELANRAAQSDAPVLLTGENGTGKELLARAIHAASARREQAFIVLNCRGADEVPWAAAAGGTLLLDEIGEMSLQLQGELLSALHKTHMLGARLISTTSQDLNALTEAGRFRQDLFQQINILPIEIPPLGRRREDIPLLVSHFLEQATDDGAGKKIYSPDAIELLATTDWPGNVRQLFELVKQNVALSHGKIMTKEFVQRSLGDDAKQVPTYDEARDEFARDYLKTNLQTAAGNVSEAARLAKRNRTDFYKLLARYRLEPDDFKTGSHAKRKKPGPAD